jgi:hypothetical protein
MLAWPTGLGKFIGLLVILAAFILAVVGQMDIKEAAMFAGCGLAIVAL